VIQDRDILYVDNHLLAVNKPAGLVTQPSDAHDDSLEGRAKAWVQKAFHKPGAVFLEAVHRIDRPVSGVVLFARTSKALSRLNAGQRQRQMTKLYWAVVTGRPPAPAGRLEHWLVHDSHQARCVDGPGGEARQAILEYRLVRAEAGLALLEVTLLTGRYHQIRAQFARIGLPLLGDRRYGAASDLPGGAIGLHHRALTFQHPVKDESIEIVAPCPDTEPWRTWSR